MKRLLINGISLFIGLSMFVQAEAQSAKKAMKAGKDSLKINQYEAAIRLFSEAIKLEPGLLDAYILRAQAFENVKKLNEASEDFAKASLLSPKDHELSFNSGRLFFVLERYTEAIHMLSISIESDKSFLPAYLIKVECLMALKNFQEALVICNNALDIKKTAQNYFNHGMVSEYLKSDTTAIEDYGNAIKLDKLYQQSYVRLANILMKQNKNDEALKYCNQVIIIHQNYTEALITRSIIYHKKSDLINAIADMSKAIDINPLNDSFYFIRAGYNHEFKQYQQAISDYSKSISWNAGNFMAYYKRGVIYDETKKKTEAVSDYLSFLKLVEGNASMLDLIKKAKQRIYDLNAETIKPEITLMLPKLNNDGSVEVAINAKKIQLVGTVSDQSPIESIKIDYKDVVFDKTLNKVDFDQETIVAGADKITISATDIYHNITTMVYNIARTEIDPPLVDIITPYTSDYNEIFLESETPTVYIEGKLVDESLIKSVTIDGVDAKFFSDKKNPNFSATINIAGKDKITIVAVDLFGNTSEKVFKLNRETARILAENPMGKTWVIFIDNSEYESFASLEGPSKDITTMKSAFSKYDIHNIIEKKNLSKSQMEKFFSIELRDFVKNQKVNSLLVWYAGHGKFINETGYWIPTDAKREEEFTYFNVNSLKAFMQSYTNYVTHVLVVTDACESGPSFYAAMRGAKKRECGDSIPAKFKSSQVFSSAGYELAADNSPFTKTFAKSLDYNTNNCIAIDNIVVTVTESIGQGTKQTPKFGKIQGLEDEDGTFFFIKKRR